MPYGYFVFMELVNSCLPIGARGELPKNNLLGITTIITIIITTIIGIITIGIIIISTIGNIILYESKQP